MSIRQKLNTVRGFAISVGILVIFLCAANLMLYGFSWFAVIVVLMLMFIFVVPAFFLDEISYKNYLSKFNFLVWFS